MQSTTSNIFHRSLAFHPSSLNAETRRSMRVGNRRVASQCCTTTGSRYGTRGRGKAPHGSWPVQSCGGHPKEGIVESSSEHPTS